jgi:hypothetical protein
VCIHISELKELGRGKKKPFVMSHFPLPNPEPAHCATSPPKKKLNHFQLFSFISYKLPEEKIKAVKDSRQLFKRYIISNREEREKSS